MENSASVVDSRPSEESAGVAPRAGSAPRMPVIDDQCVWVCNHKKGWQEGEQGVIEAIVHRLEPHIPPEQSWCVEFGAGDGVTLPLTVDPVMRRPGWKALLIEPNRPLRNRLSAYAAGYNINPTVVQPHGPDSIDSIMEREGCPADPAVMVVDVDSIEYHIVEAMKSRPIVLCVETMDRSSPMDRPDASFVPDQKSAGNILDDDFGTQLQANCIAFDELLEDRGYLLTFRTRFNSIYVRTDYVPHLRKTKLNLGCGATKYAGYEGLDLKSGTDIRKIDRPDASVDECYLSHVLEHVSFKERDAVLKEVVRVVKPGGTVKIAVPDAALIAKQLTAAEPEYKLDYIEKVMYGAHHDQDDIHHAMFTEATLRDAMHRAGLGAIRRFDSFMEDCSTNPFSLNLEGTKRWWPRIENPKVVLVLSQPRLTFTGHEMRLIKLAQELKFEIEYTGSIFWDRDMTSGSRNAIARHNPDFLIYSDYDSIMEVDDLLKMLEAIQNDPTLAAIGAVQMSRHNDKPLVLDEARDYSTDLTEVIYSHFGLTIIRREVFDELPQPWFWSVPGRKNQTEWDWDGYGRSDADISFWRMMNTMGFRVCQHNKVSIGHIVQAVKYPCDEEGRNTMLVPIEMYWRYGRPKSAVFNPKRFKTAPIDSNGLPMTTPTNTPG